MSSNSITASKSTLQNLEWPQLLVEWSQFCRSDIGRAFCETLVPGGLSPNEAQQRSRAVLELREVLNEESQKIAVSTAPNMDSLFQRIERFGAIDVEEFVQLLDFHRSVISLHHYLRKNSRLLPEAKLVFAAVDKLDGWYDNQSRLVNRHGEIVDEATSDLAALRSLAKELHQKISKRMEDYLHSRTYADLLQDQYVSVRDGRYVLPIKANFKGKLSGIIHDVSNTEATLFVEPEDVVEWNNQLKVTEKEIQLEIEKILGDVVRDTQEYIDVFYRNHELLALADVLGAFCDFSAHIGDKICAATWGDRLRFESMSHPVLAMDRNVVKNDIEWERAFLLTGPNTGGKTVLLKAVGLNVCLAATGLPVFAKDCVLPENLGQVFVCIGDEQNLKANLSTFSAHLNTLRVMYEESGPHDLLLIDEIATGTSPEEGQPLAQAFVEEVLKKGARLFVTTHYGALKQFALADERCRIASMAFDSASQRPTYELVMDIPGESSAFETAESLNFPTEVLARAKVLRGEPPADLTLAVSRLDEARKKFIQEKDQLHSQLERAKMREEQAQKSIENYGLKQKVLLSEESEKLVKQLNQARLEIEKKVKSLTTENVKEESQKLLQKVADSVADARVQVEEVKDLPKGANRQVDFDDLEKGQVVEIQGLGLGEIVELPKLGQSGNIGPKTMILVQVGELKTRVSCDRLQLVQGGRARSFRRNLKSQAHINQAKSSHKSQETNAAQSTGLSSNLICDLRGKKVEESLRRVDQMLNSLLQNPHAKITIIHGHGTSRLKDAIRDYLTKSRPDVTFRPGSWPGEGGDGVTLVESVMES